MHNQYLKHDVLLFAPYFAPGHTAGGALRSLVNIVDSAPLNISVWIITREHDLASEARYSGIRVNTWINRGRHNVAYVSGLRGFLFSMRQMRRNYTVTYLNTLWDVLFGVAPALAALIVGKRSGTILVAPRGQLSPGALKWGANRKRIALTFWKAVGKSRRVVFHASTPLEGRHILQQVGGRLEILENPDPLDLGVVPAPPHARSRGPLRFVFVSRISPKKNLIGALRAFGMVTEDCNLTIAGPIDDHAYWNECRQVIDEYSAENVVCEYVGPLEHSAIVELFRVSDCFVFPTFGENFGHVIAESLSASCPVILGEDTPWTHYISEGAGCTVDPTNIAEIAASISRFSAMDYSSRMSMSAAAGDAFSQWTTNAACPNILSVAVDAGRRI